MEACGHAGALGVRDIFRVGGKDRLGARTDLTRGCAQGGRFHIGWRESDAAGRFFRFEADLPHQRIHAIRLDHARVRQHHSPRNTISSRWIITEPPI